MKCFGYFILCIGLLLLPAAGAQSANGSGLVAENALAEVRNDTLFVAFTLVGSDLDLRTQGALVATPAVRSDSRVLELPPVWIGGKMRYKAFHRALRFGMRDTTFVALRGGRDDVLRVNYAFSLPFEPWMGQAGIFLKVGVYGCADCARSAVWVPVATMILLPPEELPLRVVYVAPPVERVKIRDLQGQAFLDFQVGRSAILPDFGNNPTELKRIDEGIVGVRDNRFATVTSIDLTGYASPEGPATLNERLSMERALALKAYLQNRYGYPDGLFRTAWKGEDWEGLNRMVAASGLADKGAILDIVTAAVPEGVRDSRLKALSGGAPYRMLLADFYPKLRRTDYRLNYTVRSFSVVEGVEVLKTAPTLMSLNEMFLVANAYPKGSDAFNEVFDIAVRVYPLDPVANLNAGAAALDEGNLQRAHQYLDRLADVPQAWNNIGVLYFREGNLDKAGEFLDMARGVHLGEATHNLEQLNIRRVNGK